MPTRRAFWALHCGLACAVPAPAFAADTVFQVHSAFVSFLQPLSRAMVATLGTNVVAAVAVKAPEMIDLRHGTDAGATAEVPAGLFGTAPMVVISRVSLAVLDGAELIANAKAPTAGLKLAHGAPGTPGAACAALLAEQLPGLVRVAVDDPDLVKALTDERADLACVDAAVAVPLARSGRVTAQIVASEDRLAALWDVSTGPELGLPLFTATAWFGVYVTPTLDVAKVHAGLQAFLANEAHLQQLADAGVTPFPLTHRTLDAHRALETSAR
jgi:tripartite-type tricarboxylate transporter receptor subunit TctC